MQVHVYITHIMHFYSPTCPYALLVFNSISSLCDTSSQTGPTSAVGLTLACPSAVREYNAFLQEHRVDVMNPAINPMTTDTIKVMTTLIVTTTPVERKAALGAVVKKT